MTFLIKYERAIGVMQIRRLDYAGSSAVRAKRLRSDLDRAWQALRASLPTLIVAPPGPATLLLNPPAVAPLPALTAPAAQADQISQVFQERAYWMFLTGHRLGDMRRLIKHLGRGAETVFPTGSYFKGGAYGVDPVNAGPRLEL